MRLDAEGAADPTAIVSVPASEQTASAAATAPPATGRNRTDSVHGRSGSRSWPEHPSRTIDSPRPAPAPDSTAAPSDTGPGPGSLTVTDADADEPRRAGGITSHTDDAAGAGLVHGRPISS